MKSQTIETTIGDLICAIRDAAQEACIEETELSEVTQTILCDLISRQAPALAA